jgi:hypothetical protein
MVRTKIKWQNTGRGILRLGDGRLIKGEEIFLAAEKEIPMAFRDVIKPIEPIPSEPEIVIDPIKVIYSLKHRGAGLYNVVNQNGKVLNEKGLVKEDAEEFIRNLEG